MATDAGMRIAAARLRGVPLQTGLAVAVAVVLADSSIVILALPDVLESLHTSVDSVAWVITAFNLVLAAAAVPAAYAARRLPPVPVTVASMLAFAAASAGCALAGDLTELVAARCAQAAAGAVVVTAALELLPAAAGSERRAAAVWAAAAAGGAAIGPAAGGALTEAFSWRAVFAVQVPVAAVVLVPLLAHRAPRAVRAAAGRPRLAPNLALAAVSAALTAALFLLVLMLVAGWGLEPLGAAAVVSAIPAAAIVTSRMGGRLAGGLRPRAAAGAILIAGGLAGLALLPAARAGWTLPPQLLIGAGLALTLAALTHAALAGRAPQAIHGGWTIAFRHGGVVVGLLILTPLFTADLEHQQTAAERSGTAIVLDSRLPVDAKLRLGQAVADRLARSGQTLPDLAPAFRAQHPDASDRPEYARIERALHGQELRAATHAFSRSFAVAAALALLALVPIAVSQGRPEL
jgi:MFS family permease